MKHAWKLVVAGVLGGGLVSVFTSAAVATGSGPSANTSPVDAEVMMSLFEAKFESGSVAMGSEEAVPVLL